MSAYQRNILVGATVMGALAIFIFMMLKFTTRTAEFFAAPQIPVHFTAKQATGLSEGSAIDYLGVEVGHVTGISRKADSSGVVIEGVVDRTPPIPANLKAMIVQSGLLGGASTISLETIGEGPQGELAAGSTIDAQYVGLQLNLIPEGLSAAAGQMGDMSNEIRQVAKQLRESGAIGDLDATVKNINATVTKAGKTVNSLQAIVDDPKTRDDLKAAIAELRSTTEATHQVADKLNHLADTTQGHVDELSKQVGDRLAQAGTLLASVQSISEKIDKGQGTAGQLVNDPKLYSALVDSSRQLNATILDLKRLIEQWEEEGASIKLK
jgi:phospholipid/cholesterol/gamma-HCH transport system substrate-binding protein